MSNLIQDYLDNLQEAKRASRVVISRQTKIDRAVGQLATKEAKDKGDPLYVKMNKHKKLFRKYKGMIHQKYGPRVRSKARR